MGSMDFKYLLIMNNEKLYANDKRPLIAVMVMLCYQGK